MDGQQAEPVRCEQHGLAVGHDGRCVLCRRSQARPPSRVGRYVVVLLVLLGAGYYLVGHRGPPRQSQPTPSATADTDAPRGPFRIVARPVAVRPPRLPGVPPAPPQAGREPPPKTGQQREDNDEDDDHLAARRRMDRLYEEAARGQAMDRVSITMYMADWCGVCRRARRWLSQNNLPCTEVNIDSPANARDLRAINSRGSVPTFVINGAVVRGFSPAGLSGAIRRATRQGM